MTTYKNRKEVPDHEKWDVSDIYESLEDWKQDVAEVKKMAEQLKQFDGEITDGTSLYDFLTLQEKLSFHLSKVMVYARLQVDVDTRDKKAEVLLDEASQLGVTASTAVSFFRPFLLSLDQSTLSEYISEVEGLAYFEDDLMDLFRYKPHVLSKEKEEVLTQLGESLSSPSKTFGMINNADIKFGKVTTEDGEKVELTRGMYEKLLKSENRSKRKEAYRAYYKPYIELNNTIASTLSSAIKTNVTLSKMKQYPSALEKSLFADQVPKEVYDNLIETTKKHLAPYHRYQTIRKNMLGVVELRQYDLSIPLVQGVDKDIPYEEAYDLMLKALAPLGEEYVDSLASFKEKRYIDVRETPGKRSGAYNMGLYGVHPFVLLNHQDNLNSLFTLAHEMGHAMHSYLSSKHQPQITAGYTIFVAEVASTVNEVLLIHYLLNQSTDDKTRKYLVNDFIDKFKGTFFTQVMFANFEKETHEMAEAGKPLNAEVFNLVYEKLFREYNGEDLVFDDEVKYGWSRIPHFYRPFYVYKYATGFAAAIQLANGLLENKEGAKEAYLEFLQSGSSEYPLDLLKKAGVDLTTSEPIEKALNFFTELVDEFEKQA
ncbi:oligoendopeptidase F [Bacillus sp. FJAT-45037]|uniref:oligoendopeptidase F n=1 Tax=Bacillus sp. FJAT-45037 TaxID=2011007 RepID=UPI000C23994D|nr:oligoendopeptidase F [Bacillus sp. FJAT-45037]